MHNRLRMTVAFFLTKDLVWWQGGKKWFWDCLVDGDLANNAMGWQWAAGCGREGVPDLADLPTKHLHAPWNAPGDVLEKASVTLSEEYPKSMVDHSETRDRALAEYNRVK